MGVASRLLLDLYPVFMQLLQCDDDEVCSNAVYGLGQLASKALPEIRWWEETPPSPFCHDFYHCILLSHYPDILQALFSIAQTRLSPRLVDNICAALCRMILVQQDDIPLHHASTTVTLIVSCLAFSPPSTCRLCLS